MVRIRLQAASIGLAFLVSRFGHGAEGKWPLSQLSQLDWGPMKQHGLALGASEVRELARAIVKFPGATGSFVSPNGLILTNQHVAFRCIAANSTPGRNLIRDGFLASDASQELVCPGLELQVLLETTDVTDQIRLAADEKIADPAQREKQREARRRALASACQAGEAAQRCSVEPLYLGVVEELHRYETISDVRLVHAPENSLADFGGDIDNFEWPRQNADYAFLRAYQDGQPYAPLMYLKLGLDGFIENDAVFMLGYPGSSSRLQTRASLERTFIRVLPDQIKRLQRRLGLLREVGQNDAEAAIDLSDTVNSTANNLKRFEGQLAGLEATQAVSKRRALEQELAQYIAADPARKQKYGTLLASIERLVKAQDQYEKLDLVVAGLRQARSFSLAYSLYEACVQRTLPDAKRRDGFHDHQLKALERSLLEGARPPVLAADERLLALAIEEALNLPKPSRLSAVDERAVRLSGDAKQKAAKLAAQLLATTQVGDRARRQIWWGMSTDDLIRTGDPLLLFAADVVAQWRAVDDERERLVLEPLNAARTDYARLLLAWQGGQLAPDANNTLRFTWGQVRGYVPARGGSRRGYATTIAQLLSVVTEQAEYQLSDLAMAQLTGLRLDPFVDRQLGDTIVNFVATLDGTGGNSGSPVLNGSGELIGLAFDGNYEGLAGSYLYDESQKREIVVDIRYVLDLMIRVYAAESLIGELQLPAVGS